MKYLGMMHCSLGREMWKNADGIFLGQGKYVVEIMKKFKILDREAIATPMASNLKLLYDASLETVDTMMYRQMIGSLMCLTNTIPDICFTLNTLSQCLADLRHVHLIAAKHILRYLKGTVYYGLKYDANQKMNLHGYVDSDWVDSAIDKEEHFRLLLQFGIWNDLLV